MKRTALVLAALAGVTIAFAAAATPDDRLLRYGGGGEGRVVFDARLHRAAGFVCNDCHLDLFATRKLALVDRAAHDAGKACFACHDGTRAFKDCRRCHRK